MRHTRLVLLSSALALLSTSPAQAEQGAKLRGDQRTACWMLEFGQVRSLAEAEQLAGRVRGFWQQLSFADDPVGPPPPDAAPAPKKKKKRGEVEDKTPPGMGLEAVTLYDDNKPGPIRLVLRCLKSRSHANRMRDQITQYDASIAGPLVYDPATEILMINKDGLHKPPEE